MRRGIFAQSEASAVALLGPLQQQGQQSPFVMRPSLQRELAANLGTSDFQILAAGCSAIARRASRVASGDPRVCEGERGC